MVFLFLDNDQFLLEELRKRLLVPTVDAHRFLGFCAIAIKFYDRRGALFVLDFHIGQLFKLAIDKGRYMGVSAQFSGTHFEHGSFILYGFFVRFGTACVTIGLETFEPELGQFFAGYT